jgi:capsular polysaccharide biosynthesis protein
VLERLRMADQLRLIGATDVLVGMHGAGLAHALFLRPGSALVELFPAYHSPATRYFRRMAECRGLFYQGWQNTDPRRERPGYRTTIPPAVVVEAIQRYLDRAR